MCNIRHLHSEKIFHLPSSLNSSLFFALNTTGPLPDLSSIEHVWDQLKRHMSLCHFARDLEVAIQDLWTRLPQDNKRRLVNSMPDHVVACIAAGGGLTRY